MEMLYIPRYYVLLDKLAIFIVSYKYFHVNISFSKHLPTHINRMGSAPAKIESTKNIGTNNNRIELSASLNKVRLDAFSQSHWHHADIVQQELINLYGSW